MKVNAYLAGPDVFFPNPIEIGRQKKAKLEEVGIKGHYPFDNEIPKEAFQNPHLAAITIAKANEQMMRNCCKDGEIGIILFNMSPFHDSPSMDVGTAYEVGFMGALAAIQKNVIIIGYTDDPRSFQDRVIDKVYGGKQNIIEKDGILYGSDGNSIEAFGEAENLMIVNAVEKTGGKIVHSFDEAVELASLLAAEKIKQLTGPERFRVANDEVGRWRTTTDQQGYGR